MLCLPLFDASNPPAMRFLELYDFFEDFWSIAQIVSTFSYLNSGVLYCVLLSASQAFYPHKFAQVISTHSWKTVLAIIRNSFLLNNAAYSLNCIVVLHHIKVKMWYKFEVTWCADENNIRSSRMHCISCSYIVTLA